MSVGYTLLKADIDNKAASLIVGVRDNLRRCSDFCAFLNDTSIIDPATSDVFLRNLGYNAQEVTWLRAAFTDLGGSTGSSLYRIFTGQAALAGANDFLFNAKHLVGVNLT
jgi:hypothetical protein